jgi:hypothetical protein
MVPLIVAVGVLLLSSSSVLAAGPGAMAGPSLVGRTTLPQISASFSGAQAPVSARVTAEFSIKNPDAAHTRTNVSVEVIFSVALVASTPRTVCGGTLTTSGNAVMLAGATISPSATCQVANIVVPATEPGVIKLQSSNVLSDVNAGNSTTASIQVFQPPTLTAAFKPSVVAGGATSVLTFTAANPAVNTFPISSIGLAAKLPAGIVVRSAMSSAGPCGGTLTVTAPDQIQVAGWTVPANGSCRVSVSVVSSQAGTFAPAGSLNFAGAALSSTGAATLTVTPPAPAATPKITASAPLATPTPTAAATASIAASSSIAPSASTLPTASPTQSAPAVVAVVSPSASPSTGPAAAAASAGGTPDGALLILAGAVIGAALALGVGGLIAAMWLRRRRATVPVETSSEG